MTSENVIFLVIPPILSILMAGLDCQIQAETRKDFQNSGRFGNTVRVLGAGV